MNAAELLARVDQFREDGYCIGCNKGHWSAGHQYELACESWRNLVEWLTPNLQEALDDI